LQELPDASSVAPAKEGRAYFVREVNSFIKELRAYFKEHGTNPDDPPRKLRALVEFDVTSEIGKLKNKN